MTTITAAEYAALVKASNILDALYRGGVDNWEWYGESLSDLEDDE